MSIFIKNAREEIVALWDDLILGEEERAEFNAFVDGEGLMSSVEVPEKLTMTFLN